MQVRSHHLPHSARGKAFDTASPQIPALAACPYHPPSVWDVRVAGTPHAAVHAVFVGRLHSSGLLIPITRPLHDVNVVDTFKVPEILGSHYDCPLRRLFAHPFVYYSLLLRTPIVPPNVDIGTQVEYHALWMGSRPARRSGWHHVYHSCACAAPSRCPQPRAVARMTPQNTSLPSI